MNMDLSLKKITFQVIFSLIGFVHTVIGGFISQFRPTGNLVLPFNLIGNDIICSGF